MSGPINFIAGTLFSFVVMLGVGAIMGEAGREACAQVAVVEKCERQWVPVK